MSSVNAVLPLHCSIIYSEWRAEACDRMMGDPLGLLILSEWPEYVGLRRVSRPGRVPAVAMKTP